MGDIGIGDDDGWHVVGDVQAREQIQQWNNSPLVHWSGHGKHIRSAEMKSKIRAGGDVLGHGATAIVDRVTISTVTMARKKIRIRNTVVEQLREEANIMEKLVHRHIVELVGTYTHGQRELFILTYPAATCNLQGFLEDIDEVRTGTSADLKDASKRFEALGFRGILYPQSRNEDPQMKALEAPLSFLMSILGCVTEAVEYVHAQKVRHQDLKPRNILLSPRQVYLADFGISRDLKDATHSLTEGFPGGTPLYLAPEVIENKAHHMSAADIYSLGCVFLTVASVLYGASHGQYESVMGGRDQSKKAANLRLYLQDLKVRALATGKANHDAATCAPKHLVVLIESMLAQEPAARPTASQVQSDLHEIGGIDQIYHGRCCKKDTAFISQLIDKKIKMFSEEQSEQMKRIQQLEARHEADKLQIESMSKTQETYELRIEHERKHVAESYKKQLEASNAARKIMEAQLIQLKNERRFSKKGPGRFSQFNAAPGPMPQGLGAPKRRGSRIPLPERPSTPLNPSPPRPSLPRETSSGNSTLQSSINSIYSRTSGATMDSNESEKSFRSLTPDTPTPDTSVIIKLPLSPVLSHKDLQDDKSDTKSVTSTGENTIKPAEKAAKTWAEMMRRPVQEQTAAPLNRASRYSHLRSKATTHGFDSST